MELIQEPTTESLVAGAYECVMWSLNGDGLRQRVGDLYTIPASQHEPFASVRCLFCARRFPLSWKGCTFEAQVRAYESAVYHAATCDRRAG